jgi:hypothetical protein
MHYFLRSLFVFLFLFPAGNVSAKVNPRLYDSSLIINATAVRKAVAHDMDSIMRQHRQVAGKGFIWSVEKYRKFDDKTTDFYLILILFIILGAIKYSDNKYFQNLWKALWNPTLSARQIKEQMESSGLANLLMNVFFAAVFGAYLYYVGKQVTPASTGNIPSSLLIMMLIGGVLAIYIAKYFVMRFSGWAFKVEGITDQYIFNVYFINKIVGIILLPFVVLIAFSDLLAGSAIIVSLCLLVILLVNRYLRSWKIFGSFFQYSKFHFFLYLCASELLPFAVLMKLLVQALLY